MHMIHPVGYLGTLLLGLFEQTTALEEFPADELIGVLIAATLPAGIGVAIVEGGLGDFLHFVVGLELRAVIHSDALEGAVGEGGHDSFQSIGDGSGIFALEFPDNLIARPALCQDKDSLAFTFGLAYDGIHFPMAGRSTVPYLLGALFDTQALRSFSGFLDFAVSVLFSGALKVFICDAGDIATVDIAVEGSGRNSPLPFFLHIASDLVRRTITEKL